MSRDMVHTCVGTSCFFLGWLGTLFGGSGLVVPGGVEGEFAVELQASVEMIQELSRSMELVATSEALGGRDAVHAATALVHGLQTIVSPDTAFDGIDGLYRLAPTDDVSELGG
jgi:hypothetical protein